MIARQLLAALLLTTIALPWSADCAPRTTSSSYDGVTHPDWVKDRALYELNLRQFTPEGTLATAERDLPRLKALGVGVIWLMPIYPTGIVKAVPPLGSPYAVRDFRAVDPAYGTIDDLHHFVAAAHGQGLHVILDWVGNHSAWDNALVRSHPDWYTHDVAGHLQSPPWFGWGDVVEFDYAAPGLRRYMLEAMAFWVREADVDGFRADAAGLVPLDFWEAARKELDAIKPVFMLAEWESRDLSFRAFDMTYGWSWAKAMEDLAQGHGSLGALRTYYAWDRRFWPSNAMRMLYVSNHDVIGQGTEFERYGPALDAAIALSIVSEGMPLIFNGQEAGNRQHLDMFKRDPIDWHDDAEGALYRRLLALRRDHPALWARPWGGTTTEVLNDDKEHILSFARTVSGDTILAVFNFSPDHRKADLHLTARPGPWHDLLSQRQVAAASASQLDMPPWSYRLLAQDAWSGH